MGYSGPEWVKNAVFYQIFPDRFARVPHDKSRRMYSFEAWDSQPTRNGYKGGTLDGIRDRLDYLQDLGINAIYLNPIFWSTANHRYHTCDYFRVDPLLGGNKAFDALLGAAHSRNMRVVLDGVFNHVGRGFLPFNDLVENGPASAWVNWFHVFQWPIRPYHGESEAGYACWHNLPALPKLNHDNQYVRDFLFKVAEYWLRKGIDGWRLDAPECIQTPGFWEEFRVRVKAINPEAYLVGEILPEAVGWLDGDRFDGVTNYPLYGALLMFAAQDYLEKKHVKIEMTGIQNSIDRKYFSSRLLYLMELHSWEATLLSLNFLETHDVPRFLTIVNGYRPALETALVLLFTLPGAPTVYYGGEVGVVGNDDPDCRRSFPPESAWDITVHNLYKKFIALRRAHAVLRTGKIVILGGQEAAVCYLRHDEANRKKIFIAVNANGKATRLHLNVSDLKMFRWDRVICGSGTLHLENDQLTLTLPPRGFLIAGG